MSAPIMNQARAVLNALQEGEVITVVRLYDDNMLKIPYNKDTRYTDIKGILAKTGMKQEDVDYWIDDYFQLLKHPDPWKEPT